MAVGSFYTGDTGIVCSGIARLNSDGTRDASFDPDAGLHLSGAINRLRTGESIVRQPDGNYLVGGSFTAYDETPVDYVVRILSTGAIDPSFVADEHDNRVRAIDRQAGGRVLTGGDFTIPDAHFVRLMPVEWRIPVYPLVALRALAAGGSITKDEGALFLGGYFFSYEGTPVAPLSKWYLEVTPMRCGARNISAVEMPRVLPAARWIRTTMGYEFGGVCHGYTSWCRRCRHVVVAKMASP